MAFIPSGPSYTKTISPLGGTRHSPLNNSRSYARHSSPFFGRSYSSPCNNYCNNSLFFRPWFQPYSPPVVVYDNSPREITPHSNIVLNALLATIVVVITIAVVNSALTRTQICTMGRDCDDFLNRATGYMETRCSALYERCV